MINDFDNIVSNAKPIEIHSDRMKNGALKFLQARFGMGKILYQLK